MKKFGRILTACAAVAVAAGIGLTAAPAQASTAPGVSGDTSIVVPTSIVDALGGAGIALSPTRHSTAVAVDGGVLVGFPVTLRPAVDGLLAHGGGFKFTFPGSSAKAPIKFFRPWIETCSSVGPCPVVISVAINKTRIDLFVVDNLTSSRHKKNGVITETFRGSVFVTNDAGLVNQLNAALGANVLTPGMSFGNISSRYTITL